MGRVNRSLEMARVHQMIRGTAGTLLVVVPEIPLIGFSVYGACINFGLDVNLILPSKLSNGIGNLLKECRISIMTSVLASQGFICDKENILLIEDRVGRYSDQCREQIYGRSAQAYRMFATIYGE